VFIRTYDKMVQVVDYEEFKEAIRRIESLEEDNIFLKSLLLAERWLSRKQAMHALGCKDSKLWQLTRENQITHRYEGKSPLYDVFSIRVYLEANKIDAKEANQRIISARFSS